MALLIKKINALLPEGHKIDPAHLVQFEEKGCSQELLEHVVYGRLESRLRKLDKRGSGSAKVRNWEGSFAEKLLKQSEFVSFRTPRWQQARAIDESDSI